MMPRKQFEQWFRHQLYVDTDNGQCKKFVVKHVNSVSRAGNVLITIDVPNETNDDWITESIALIESTTSADAGGGGGVQSYAVFSYHGDDRDKSTARFTIKMQGDPNLDDDEISSEPATKTGLLAQLMRHNEATMRSATMAQTSVMSMMQKTLAQQSSMIEKLVEEKFNNISTVEALLSQKNERDIEMMKAERSVEMKEKAFDTLKIVAPTILNKLLTSGNPKAIGTPEAISARDKQLAALADTMTTEQLEQLQRVFSPEQLMLFVDVFTQIKQQQELIKTNENK